jgi:3-oxoacyl-[acyl-carrier protein] reductase
MGVRREGLRAERLGAVSAEVVLVTGGSRGIGRAIAQHLAANGHRVAIAARNPGTTGSAVDALEGDGHLGLELDVADESAWTAALERVDAAGSLGGLVCAAGVLGPIGSIGSWRPADFADTIAVNLQGTLLALHHCLPRLAETGGAAVTLSGGGATGPLPRFDAYAASKAAVVRLTENLAADGARVNAVAPGFIATDIHEATLAAGPDAVGREYYERTKQGLAEGGADLDEVCGLVAFLLSSEATSINGKLISAQWDPWRDEGFRARLAADPDLATLRRIDEQKYTSA